MEGGRLPSAALLTILCPLGGRCKVARWRAPPGGAGREANGRACCANEGEGVEAAPHVAGWAERAWRRQFDRHWPLLQQSSVQRLGGYSGTGPVKAALGNT